MNEVVNVAKVTPGCLLDPSDLNRPPGPGERSEGKKTKRRDPNASRVSMREPSGMDVNSGIDVSLTGKFGGDGSKDASTNKDTSLKCDSDVVNSTIKQRDTDSDNAEDALKAAAVTKLSRNLLLAAVIPGLTAWYHHKGIF